MARIIETQQGTDAWHQHRASQYNASDAPAMMGVSSYKSRGALLHEKHTGIAPEVDAATQRRFDLGHEYEATARPWAEEIIGEELYPVVLADEVDGMPLSASLDGLTMDDSTAFEHKTLNENLRQCIDSNYRLPEMYRVQMEQQMLLSGATRCLFMASAGDRDEARWCWYEQDPALQQRVIDGWIQFGNDLQNYEPPGAEKVITGAAPSALPALRIELTGAVAESNLDAFRDHALAVINSINTDLQTDEQFADAEATVKWCKTVESKLAAAKDHALSQTADIDTLFRTIDEISEQTRQKRLELDKLVKSMKEQRKNEIVRAAENSYDAHIGAIEKDLERGNLWPIRFPAPTPMIAQAMKGKRTIATLQDAADTAVANAKIEADRIAREIRASIDALATEIDGYQTLFPDAGELVTQKSSDDLRNLAKARIAEHQEQERQRAEREAEQRRWREEQRAKEARRFDEQRQSREAEETARRARGKCDGNHGGPVCDDPECWNDNDRQQAIRGRAPELTRKPVDPPSDEQIIACIADAFNVSHSTARDWIAGMDLVGAEA